MQPATLVEMLEQAAARYPARPAFRFGEDELTYAELLRDTRALAARLSARGIRPGDRVGICVQKGLEMPVAAYGVMAAGAIFVPIDPLAPAARISRILRQCAVRVTIASPPLAARLPVDAAHILVADPEKAWLTGSSPAAVRLPNVSGQNCAYIIFTSGSTGEPKGIVHTHRSALAFVQMMVEHFGLKPEDRVSGLSPLHFDMSTFDIFAANRAGACTVLISEAHQKVPASLTALVEMARLTVWYSTPVSLIQALDYGGLEKRDWEALRWLIYAGEPFPVRHLNRLMSLLPGARFSNAYGPAETNVCHIFDLPRGSWSGNQVPIGFACADVVTRVVDDEGNDAIEGELWVRAPTMLSEYWRSPEATARAVVTHRGRRFYRTGDIVSVTPTGLFEFLGRRDRQVKVRGFRIELDEVEQALTNVAGVARAGVSVLNGAGSRRAIVADVMLEPGAVLSAKEIRKSLLQELPRYAVPERLAIRSGLPLTSSGKLDRRAMQVTWQSEHGRNH